MCRMIMSIRITTQTYEIGNDEVEDTQKTL